MIIGITAVKVATSTTPRNSPLNSAMVCATVAVALCDPGFTEWVHQNAPAFEQLHLDVWHVAFICSAGKLAEFCLPVDHPKYQNYRRSIWLAAATSSAVVLTLGRGWRTFAPLLHETTSWRFPAYYWVYAIIMGILSGAAVCMFIVATLREGGRRQRFFSVAAAIVAVAGIGSMLWIAYGTTLMALGLASEPVREGVTSRVYGAFMVTFLAPLYSTVLPSVVREVRTRWCIRRLRPMYNDLLIAVPAVQFEPPPQYELLEGSYAQLLAMQSLVSDAAVSLYQHESAQNYVRGAGAPSPCMEAEALLEAILNPSGVAADARSLQSSVSELAKEWKPVRARRARLAQV